jgi:hypothetical protein
VKFQYDGRLPWALVIVGCSSENLKTEFLVQLDHRLVTLPGVRDHSTKTMMASIRDLPTFKQVSKAQTPKERYDARRGNVKGAAPIGVLFVGTDVLLEVNVGVKCATANFSAVDNHPPGIDRFPIIAVEPVGRVLQKSLAIENQKASDLLWSLGSSEFSFHRLRSFHAAS